MSAPKSCPRLEQALRRHRWFGPYLAMAKKGMPRRAKIVTLAAMWCGILVRLRLLDGAGSVFQGTVLILGIAGTVALLLFVRRPAPDA
jgi:uncharacterized membrane protein YbaN (DUF454 family)